MRDLSGRAVRLVEVETHARRRSPGRCCSAMSARSCTRATARWPRGGLRRSRWTAGLLAELLGSAELRELLDPDAMAEIEAELQRLAPSARPAASRESLTCCACSETSPSRRSALGPATKADRRAVPELESARRALAGADCRRGALGRRRGRRPAARRARGRHARRGAGRLPRAGRRSVRGSRQPIRPHPWAFSGVRRGRCATASGVAVVTGALERLAREGGCCPGSSGPADPAWSGATPRCCACCAGAAWPSCARGRAGPVAALARFLPDWQGAGRCPRAESTPCCGRSSSWPGPPCRRARSRRSCCRRACATTPRLCSMSCAPAARWSGPAAVRCPATTAGCVWSRPRRPRCCCRRPLDLPPSEALHEAILGTLDGGQALFFRALSDAAGAAPTTPRWSRRSGTWCGPAASPTTPWLRCACGSPARPAPGASRRAGCRGARRATPATGGPPCPPGRGPRRPAAAGGGCPIATDGHPAAACPRRGAAGPPRRAHPRRGGRRAGVRRVLRRLSGAVGVRGRRALPPRLFVEGLGAAQFAVPGAVDRMRALAAEAERADEEPAWTSPIPPSWEVRDAARAGASSPRWCWRRPTRPTRTAGRSRGPTA